MPSLLADAAVPDAFGAKEGPRLALSSSSRRTGLPAIFPFRYRIELGPRRFSIAEAGPDTVELLAGYRHAQVFAPKAKDDVARADERADERSRAVEACRWWSRASSSGSGSRRRDVHHPS